ncbi:MAG TPA: hypothetical protein VHV78_09035 [Gemmatimonadaceae bacterium]|jgi:hypothetical protein|nr:hypothetical protein [Gemmatimonadaceae bacterium]
MRIVGSVFGVLVAIIGIVWFLQGVDVLPGSFMTGQMKWAIFGAIAFVVGVGIFFASRRS